MYWFLHLLLVAAYAILPLGALALSIYITRRTKARTPVAGFILTCCSAAILGMALTVFYAVWSGVRHVGIAQLFLAMYVMVGMLCAIKALSWGTQRLAARALRLKPADKRWRRGGKQALIAVAQLTVMTALGLPYAVSTLATFRPRVGSVVAADLQHFDVDQVSFPAVVDGTSIAGYWVSAGALPMQASVALGRRWGKRTVIVCGGDEERRGDQGWLIQQLTADGFNVLAIDSRGHGDSGGQWTSFGDLERRDVLGAVRWIDDNRSDQAQRIFALGMGSGGGAVIGAAADPSAQGQHIYALAVIGGFADFKPVLANMLAQRFSPPLQWLLMHVAVPMASAQAGADLSHYSPGNLMGKIECPVLVIHGTADTWAPFEQGEELFEKAYLPKEHDYLNTDRSGVLHDPSTGRVLIQFFDTARRLPII